MKIYIDGVLLLNFAFDFILLMTTNIILKRNAKLIKIILSSFFGSLTILILFINISSFMLFIIKIVFSIIMLIISFGFKDIKYFIKNFLYFYTISFLLGGFLYYINTELSYKNIGMVFYHVGLSVNYYFIILVSPLILYLYIKQVKGLKNYYSLNYSVVINMGKREYKLRGYLDTANNIKDPYNNRMVIIVNDKKFIKEIRDNPFILVPYDTIDNHGLLKCVIPKRVYIENIGVFNNIVIGLSSKKINMEGINCILNAGLIGEMK